MLSLLLAAVLSTAVTCLPTYDMLDVGKACTGEGLTDNCTSLKVTEPNKCQTATSGTLPFSRSILSLEITSAVTCAFFTLEACIHPQGTADMLIAGPVHLDRVPDPMVHEIQAYICSPAADEFASGAAMEPGSVIVNVNRDVPSSLEQESFELARRSEVVEEIPADKGSVADDGRGATVYKQQNLQGTQVPNDVTAIPGSSFCVNMSNLFGNWDAKVRSLKVEPSYKCKFFTATGCAASAKSLELGKKGAFLVVNKFSSDFEGKIHSMICSQL